MSLVRPSSVADELVAVIDRVVLQMITCTMRLFGGKLENSIELCQVSDLTDIPKLLFWPKTKELKSTKFPLHEMDKVTHAMTGSTSRWTTSVLIVTQQQTHLEIHL